MGACPPASGSGALLRGAASRRHPPLCRPQPPGAAYPDTFGPGLDGAEDGLFHGPAVGYPPLHLLGYRAGHQKGIKLGLADFLDIQADPLAHDTLKVKPHLVNPRPAAPDDDTRPGGIDGHRHILRLAVNLHQ